MSAKSKVAGAVAVVLVLLCLGVYFAWFHMWTTAHVVSVSPDGMYKCELTERSDVGQSVGRVILYRRMSPWDRADWQVLDSGDVRNDSVSRSNYSIVWAYNEKQRSTKVIVFGDFGSAPFEGTIVYERTLDPQIKLRGEK